MTLWSDPARLWALIGTVLLALIWRKEIAAVLTGWRRTNWRAPRVHHRGGMLLAAGLALALLASAGSWIFGERRVVALPIGGTISIAGAPWRLTGVEPVAGPDWSAIRAALDSEEGRLRPDWRFYRDRADPVVVPATLDGMTSRLSVRLTRLQPHGQWVLAFDRRPFHRLTTLGLALALAGLVIGVVSSVRREQRIRWRRQWGD